MSIIGNTVKDDVVVLGAHEFKRAKNGLDETQVASFINELIDERDKLAQSQEHVASLNRLAERTIVEADKLAIQIKTEAAEQAKAESAAIVDKAKEQARQTVEKKVAEAVRLANEEANATKAKAEEEAAQRGGRATAGDPPLARADDRQPAEPDLLRGRADLARPSEGLEGQPRAGRRVARVDGLGRAQRVALDRRAAVGPDPGDRHPRSPGG